MSKYNRRNTNRQHLTGRHNNRKNDWTKFLDGVENAELARGGSNSRDDIVQQRNRAGAEIHTLRSEQQQRGLYMY